MRSRGRLSNEVNSEDRGGSRGSARAAGRGEAHSVTPSIDCSAATLVYESTPGTTLSYEILVNGRMGRPGMIRRLTPLGGRLV